MRLFAICLVLAGATLAVLSQTTAPQAQTNAPQPQAVAPQAQTNAPQPQAAAPQAQTNAPQPQVAAPQVQTNALQLRKLSLEDCIQLALEHNLDVQIHRLNPDLSLLNLRAAYGVFDPSLSLSGEHDYSKSAGGLDQYGRAFGGIEADVNSFSSALSGTLPWGTAYSLGGRVSDTYGTQPGTGIGPAQVFTNSFVDINTGKTVSFLSTNYSTVPTRSFFESVSGGVGLFSLRQPLLRNLWIDNNRLQILIDKSNVKVSELDLRAQVINSITAVEQAYFSLIFAQENIRVQQLALQLAEELVAQNKKKVQVGSLAPLDEKQAEYQAAGSRADLIGAVGDESTSQRALKSLLSDDYSHWEHVSVQPIEQLVAVPERFSLQERLAQRHQPQTRPPPAETRPRKTGLHGQILQEPVVPGNRPDRQRGLQCLQPLELR